MILNKWVIFYKIQLTLKIFILKIEFQIGRQITVKLYQKLNFIFAKIKYFS